MVGEGDVKAQAAQVYRNLAAILAEAGCTLRDVVKFTTFLVRNEDWAPFAEWRRAEYPKLFPDGVYPANTGVVVVGARAPDPAPRGGGHRRAAGRAGGAPPAAAGRRGATPAGPRRRRRRPGRAGGVAPERPSGGVVVTVRYIFGLARAADGRDALSLELPPGSTVFEALRRLGLSALELHAAVNGESAADGTVLRDGDEMILIPSIQGGVKWRRGHEAGDGRGKRARGPWARRRSGGAGGGPDPRDRADRHPDATRGVAAAGAHAVHPRHLPDGVAPAGRDDDAGHGAGHHGAPAGASVSSPATPDRWRPVPAGTHRSVSGHGRPAPRAGRNRRPGPDAGDRRRTSRDSNRDARAAPAPVSIQRAAGLGQQTLIITSEAPIDAPIVILAP